MELEMPYIEKTTRYYHQTGTVLEPAGYEKRRRRPKNTWRRNLEKDRSNIDKSWRELEILARDRRTCNVIVTDLCPQGS
jgi:hypothetical protein